MENHKLESSREGTSTLRGSLALLRQHYHEENAANPLILGKEDIEDDDIDVSKELNAWRGVYSGVESLCEGDGLQSKIFRTVVDSSLATDFVPVVQSQCLIYYADF